MSSGVRDELPGDVVVLADQPFAEIGEPDLVVDDEAFGFLVVGGDLGYSQWFGYGGATKAHHRLGVYDRHTLACRRLVVSRWPVNDIAIHPTARFVVAGTGSYDGGYFWEGQLLLIDLDTGTVTSMVRGYRQVVQVAWTTPTTVRVLVAPADEGPAHQRPTHEDPAGGDLGEVGEEELVAEEYELDLGDLDHPVADGIHLEDHRFVPRPFEVAPYAPNTHAARLRAIAAAAGRTWALRRAVWALEALPNGGLLAGCEGVALERWDPDTTQAPRWQVPVDPGTGCQVTALSETTVMTTVALPHDEDAIDWAPRSRHDVVDTTTGEITASITPKLGSIAVRASKGPRLLRSAYQQRAGSTVRNTGVLITTDGTKGGSLDLGGYDPFNHWFDIRHAPDPLLLVGQADQAHRDKWVCTLTTRSKRWPRSAEARPGLRRLFPLEWDSKQDRHLFGGPGVFIDDTDGRGLIHTAQVHSSRGNQQAFLVRRHYPTGKTRWITKLDATPTGVDVHGRMLVASTIDGALSRVDTRTGVIRERSGLSAHGMPVVVLSVSADRHGVVSVGLLDGRIIRGV